MGVPQAMEAVAARAALIRESLQKSQTVTDNMVAILGSFDHRLSALETAMRPTQIRTHSIRRAHENIDKTLKRAEVILGQFDLTRKAEAKILRGPHEDLESYLEAIDQQLLTNYSKPVEPDRLFDCLPDSLRPSSDPSGQKGDGNGKLSTKNKSLQPVVYIAANSYSPRVSAIAA
ncbi:hypothetical protein M0R45_029959 [Rubus argutus]|uniref:Uncharacterized protein n=1 Tax=Rubus argutus TaxID=59490 RepID=A0AAW1WDH6_RUBAR